MPGNTQRHKVHLRARQPPTLGSRALAALSLGLPAQVVAITGHALTQPPSPRPGLHRDAALAEIGDRPRRNADELAEFGGGHGLVIILHDMSLNQRRRTWKRVFFDCS